MDISLRSIIDAMCPSCGKEKITEGLFGMKKICPSCGYNLHPENGYYLGAMMVAFFVNALLTIPPVIFLKVQGFEDRVLIAYPFIQYLILGPLLVYYAKVLWAHVGYHTGRKMDQ